MRPKRSDGLFAIFLGGIVIVIFCGVFLTFNTPDRDGRPRCECDVETPTSSKATESGPSSQTECPIIEACPECLECPTPKKPSFLDLHQLPVVVFTHNRADYLERTLNSILDVRKTYSRAQDFPIIVSQDGVDEDVSKVIEQFPDVLHLYHVDAPKDVRQSGEKGYFAIAQHYGWVLHHIFDFLNFEAVVLLEDDMEIATDFFDYMAAAVEMFEKDPTIYCVSGYNDNGQRKFVKDPARLYRSDFFPGLGWIMPRSLWVEFRDKWPNSYWDDWMRLPEQRRDRACIRPEISRTKTFGKTGTSAGQFFDKHLGNILLNDQKVNFDEKDLSYLVKDAFDVEWDRIFDTATSVSGVNPAIVRSMQTASMKVPVAKSKFPSVAESFGIMPDEKAGIRRTAYKGRVLFHYEGRTVILFETPD